MEQRTITVSKLVFESGGKEFAAGYLISGEEAQGAVRMGHVRYTEKEGALLERLGRQGWSKGIWAESGAPVRLNLSGERFLLWGPPDGEPVCPPKKRA